MTALTLCTLIITALLGTADTAETLLERYRTARISIVNQRGLAPGDLEALQELRNEFSQWNADHNDFQVIAAELQINFWLNDAPKCKSLFGKLLKLQPDNSKIALAWADYTLSNDDNSDPGVIYEELIQQFPKVSGVVLAWVKYLDNRNQFTDAIIAIEKLDAVALALPEILEVYADLLFANNRFDEAASALKKIDLTLPDNNPALTVKINSKIDRFQDAATRWQNEVILREVEETADDLPRVLIITSKGPILLELFEDHAPNTVANFISLAESGYYDATRFHRVLPKFMAQGGDPNSREGAEGTPGSGGPGYTIKDEHTGENVREHFAGSLSMAKTAAPNSAGSQFFLTHLPTPHLDGRHTVFGRIITGLKIARSIEENDDIIAMTIVRKRDHDYIPETIGDKKVELTPKLGKPSLSPNSKDE